MLLLVRLDLTPGKYPVLLTLGSHWSVGLIEKGKTVKDIYMRQRQNVWETEREVTLKDRTQDKQLTLWTNSKDTHNDTQVVCRNPQPVVYK